MEAMLRHTIERKKLPFRGVLMDTWYATNHLMKVINDMGKFFYCPIKENRKVHPGVHWTSPKHLDWDADALKNGYGIHQNPSLIRALCRLQDCLGNRSSN
jgi:hypothetical protein